MKITKNRSGNYSVRFKTATGFTTLSLKTKSLQEAKKLVKEAEIEDIEALAKVNALQRDAITSVVAGKNIHIREAIEGWKSYKINLSQSENTIFTQESLLNAFVDMHKLTKLNQITEKHISAYINEPGDIKAGAREQRLSAIKSLFQFCVANCYTLKDPSKLVAVDKSKLTHKNKEVKKRVPMTEFEYKHIMLNAGFFFKEATALSWWTGMRLSDIARLEWDSINFESRTLIVHTKKTDARICLPLDDPLIGGGVLLDILSSIETTNSTYCFPEQCSLDQDPKRRSTLSVYYGRMLGRLNIVGKSFHCLRHSFVSRCKKEGKSLEDIAVWVGHSSQETTKIYDHP